MQLESSVMFLNLQKEAEIQLLHCLTLSKSNIFPVKAVIDM